MVEKIIQIFHQKRKSKISIKKIKIFIGTIIKKIIKKIIKLMPRSLLAGFYSTVRETGQIAHCSCYLPVSMCRDATVHHPLILVLPLIFLLLPTSIPLYQCFSRLFVLFPFTSESTRTCVFVSVDGSIKSIYLSRSGTLCEDSLDIHKVRKCKRTDDGQDVESNHV